MLTSLLQRSISLRRVLDCLQFGLLLLVVALPWLPFLLTGPLDVLAEGLLAVLLLDLLLELLLFLVGG